MTDHKIYETVTRYVAENGYSAISKVVEMIPADELYDAFPSLFEEDSDDLED